MPTVSWTKTPKYGDLMDRAYVETNEKESVLIAKKVDRYDSGKYIVSAENSVGRKEAMINVKVLGLYNVVIYLIFTDSNFCFRFTGLSFKLDI